MRKAALIATALVFGTANLAAAMPLSIAAAQAVAAASDGLLTPVQDKKKGKTAKKAKKSSGASGAARPNTRRPDTAD